MIPKGTELILVTTIDEKTVMQYDKKIIERWFKKYPAVEYDYAKMEYRIYDYVLEEVIPMQYKPTRFHDTVLIIAGNYIEAKEFALFMDFRKWEFLDNYRRVFNYRGWDTYIVGGGRYREDFPAIEGLFIQANLNIIDMET